MIYKLWSEDYPSEYFFFSKENAINRKKWMSYPSLWEIEEIEMEDEHE